VAPRVAPQYTAPQFVAPQMSAPQCCPPCMPCVPCCPPAYDPCCDPCGSGYYGGYSVGSPVYESGGSCCEGSYDGGTTYEPRPALPDSSGPQPSDPSPVLDGRGA